MVGFGVTGRAVTTALREHGIDVVVVDDHPSAATVAAAQSFAVELLQVPTRPDLDALLPSCDALLPSPGVPDHHPVFAAARAAAVPVLSEFDLAGAWDDRPLLAVTGTDGKTTVTAMVTDMFERSGRKALAVGNTDIPLVEAIERDDVEVFVVEASSFRLAHTRHFVPQVATWLNFAEDHLDNHGSLESYERSKARLWSDLGPDDGVAVANADDPVVMANVRPDLRTVTFSRSGSADYFVDDGRLFAVGEPLVAVDELVRSFPHDVSNALAAAATALEGGADVEGVRQTLRAFAGLPHRVSHVGTWAGVSWYDDSKATTPQAALAAGQAFEHLVLIAGGRNKGLDLSPLAALSPRLRAVVAIGEAADDVASVFARMVPTVEAGSMAEAVAAAAAHAQPGDAVVLSPACASFDWYPSYAARGDDYAALVRRRHEGGS